MFKSLKFRLTSILLVALIVLTSGAAFVLEVAFYNSLTGQLNQRMQTQFFMILTASEEEQPGNLYLPEVVREDNFNLIDSGHYAFVHNRNNLELWRSFSAVDLNYASPNSVSPGSFDFSLIKINNREYFKLTYAVIWESEDDSEHFYQFTLLHEANLLYNVTREFRMTLWSGLGFVLVAMMLIVYLALRWGLSPLKLIAEDLEQIESGKRKTLSENYPLELKPLTENLNLLIEAERIQREKYKNTLSNLAHSLKTPLAVLKGAVHELPSTQEPSGLVIQTQIDRMDEIIQYQLYRAISGTQGHILSSVNANICVEKILTALSKVYKDKCIEMQFNATENSRFFGDEGDFMEMMGNLLDNACKWTVNKVAVDVRYCSEKNSHFLEIDVSDNGPGIPPENRQAILNRGLRLDEKTEGQGIGLSVVSELVVQYSGQISIEESDDFGAKFCLRFEFSRA